MMFLKKIILFLSIMDKIWNPQAWPKPLYQNLPIFSYIKSTVYTLTQYTFPSKFIDYLLNVCSEKEVGVEIVQLTLSIGSRYMIKNHLYSEPIQLVILVSLYLAGKVIGNSDGTSGGFSINQLHKYSNHSFTNKGNETTIIDFYRIEKRILEQLNFDILHQGICDKQVKAILTMIKQVLEPTQYKILCKVSQDVQIILWHYIFTKGEKDKFLKKIESNSSQNRMQNLLTAAIIQVSFILCTQCVGRFPATVWIIHVLDLKQDELSLYVEDVLKIVLGRQKFQQLKI